jgi:hypothetical protein
MASEARLQTSFDNEAFRSSKASKAKQKLPKHLENYTMHHWKLDEAD